MYRECTCGRVGRFMRRYHRRLPAWSTNSAAMGEGSPSVVDDLIQETYLKICDNDTACCAAMIQNTRMRSSRYLKVIAANVVHDRFKALHAEKRGGNQIAEDPLDTENRIVTGEAWEAQWQWSVRSCCEIDVLLKADSEATRDRDRNHLFSLLAGPHNQGDRFTSGNRADDYAWTARSCVLQEWCVEH